MHKKYIKKNGKVFGPYLYENKRLNGKVVTSYVGKPERKMHLSYILIFIILVIFLIISPKMRPTGFSVFQFLSEEIAPADNESLIDSNTTLDTENSTAVTESIPQSSEREISNESLPNTTLSADESIDTHDPIILNQPVKWTRKTAKENDLPVGAMNITVNKDGKAEKHEGKHIAASDADEIEYYTEAPQAQEEDSRQGKRVKISGPEDLHYTDVHAFTNISEDFKIKDPSRVKVYWVESSQYITPDAIQDTDGNGVYDYVSWTVPHLSTQTFEIIVISGAEHLDTNREFISDIYNEVNTLDNVWSGPIGNGEYVRITFERPLDSGNDISIWPRIVSGTPTIEIYEQGKDTVITSFTNIQENAYNKVLLANLQGNQDTFDLKIIGGSVEFDHIIDPPTGIVTLFFNSTITGGSFPARAMKLGTGSPNAVNISWPGEFDANQVPTDASGIGQWFPIIAAIANTTATNPANNASLSSRLNYSVGPGWIWDDNLTGYQISQGDFQFNISLMGGQAVAIVNGERTFVRVSIVNVTSGAFHVVKDLFATNCTGGVCGGGQSGWRASNGARQNHPAVNQIYTNVSFNITSNQSHIFQEGEWLYIELGFGDADSTTDRTIGLRYNIANTFVKTPRIYEASPPVVNLYNPEDGATITSSTVGFNSTFTDNTQLANATLYIWNETSLVNTTFRAITGTINNTNISVTLPAEGTYFWNYLVYDNESNFAWNASNFTLIYQAPDITPPLVTINQPQNQIYTTLPIIFNVTLNESGICNYTLDSGVNNKTMQNNANLNFNASNASIADGGYTV
ncbi:hypothetical protein KW805_03525, partial [Candidatus Pacearchaeota archaeon]|nr:hypothetical protein [Candidatus Pacearchaeota archaeon]